MSVKTYKKPHKQGLYDPANEKDSCGVGFIAHIKGHRSHKIIQDAGIALEAMTHRGACGCEANTGDGAGIMTALPHDFFTKVASTDLAVTLPAPGHYAAGLVFLPQDANERKQCKAIVEDFIRLQNQSLIGWRPVPVDPDAADIGPSARATEPVIEQLFIGASEGFSDDAFERQLYLIRKQSTKLIRNNNALEQRAMFYVCSLSTKVIIYKGQLMPEQVMKYFPDLNDPDFTSHLAMVHSRFSTNTFPSWDRAQPNRFMSHNGEINTLRGNQNWMHAREGLLNSALFDDELAKILPVVEPDCSDSGTFDNVLEFLLMSGRTLQESVMMMVPEAWQNHETMSEDKRAFYEYNSALMEPWDGPASIVFTDGKYIGAVLDRNGLRPSRYYLTHDDHVIMASEVGVVAIEPENVKFKGRLQPGRMFLVDFEQGRLIPDEELKSSFAAKRPYGDWLTQNRMQLSDLNINPDNQSFEPDTLMARMQAFGFTSETMQFMLIPMVREKRDPLGSMGNDSALACLSDQPRMLYDYFKQLFAQVTNPSIDSIREETIMSLRCFIGPEKNLIETTAEHCHRLLIEQPILSNPELTAIQNIDHRGWSTKTIDITWPKAEGNAGLEKALDRICAETELAIEENAELVILSDRNVSADRIALPALLATGAVHQHLLRLAQRTRIGLVLETGEAREVHHHCLLIGFGADAINPYLAFESLWQARRDGLLDNDLADDNTIVKTYQKAVGKGMLKVMAKMGISTLQSYKGGQIFEAIGLRDAVIERCFKGTASRIQGVDFDVIASETSRRHLIGYPKNSSKNADSLPNQGEFHWRANGEKHMWDPEAISNIQLAARTNNHETYAQFAEHMNRDSKTRCTIKGLLEFKENVTSIPLDEVESAQDIVKRFCTGAMSFGSISAEAHESLAIAMNRLGGKSNTGEGGEDSARFTPMANG
ncbi:MAG TPA: glutamate synthase subunit alpha, partial [Methylococcales bacterium]|nr:glutamate synthase subunit alpha [Methylococcales bacterium]